LHVALFALLILLGAIVGKMGMGMGIGMGNGKWE
jgi:hypothetical protein